MLRDGDHTHLRSVYTVVRIVVWLWEGGTLWIAKWTRRGQEEPHPSITRVDKGGLHNTKLDVPSQTFSTTHGDAHRANHPQVSCPLTSLAPLEPFSNLFPVKSCCCSWCVSAQTWAQSRRERERDIEEQRQRGEREREERSPFPLSDVGRFEERTWGDAQARIFITRNNTQHMILRIICQWALVEVRWSL